MNSKIYREKVLLLVFCGLGLEGLAGGCTSPAAAEVKSKAPPNEAWLTPEQLEQAKIKTDVVDQRNVHGEISVGGKIAFDDLRVTHVFSPVTGRITKVLAQPGQHVRKGAPLATIASPDLGIAFSDLAKAKADLDAAEHEFNRQKDLYAAHAGAQRDLEAAEDNYKKAVAEFERSRQKAKLFRSEDGDKVDVTQDFVLRSPIEGDVVGRAINPGIEVQGLYAGGNPIELFTIGALDEVWMLADVPEMDLARVHEGDKVRVKVIAYANQAPYEGKVDWVSAVLDPQMRTAKVRCTIKNPDKAHLLKPEMYGTAIIEGTGEPALSIPRSAVLRLGEQTVVFVARGKTEDGKLRFERQPVIVDEEEAGDRIAVKHGLQQGDVVVIDGAILLSEMT
jgi:cobalt-zinc-cadmium efflux system membrane fusion protein